MIFIESKVFTKAAQKLLSEEKKILKSWVEEIEKS